MSRFGRLHGTRWSLAGIVTLLAAAAGPAHAHDAENTHVQVTITGQTFQIDIVNDPDWLWLNLSPGAGQVVPDAAERDRQLSALVERFASQVRLRLDGAVVDADDIEYVGPVEDAASAPMGFGEPGMFRLSGTLPDNAARLQLTYSLVIDQFPMTLSVDGGTPLTRWLLAGEESRAFELAGLQPMTRLQVSRQYLRLGYTHILPKGLDHILFVLAIFLLSTSWKPVLVQVSAFTVAHTITLGLTIYGVFSLAPTVVEPLIAVSITYVAVENLVARELQPWRVAIVFAFGLLHGMGFAGVLAELGLPRSEFVTALLSFNVGVEAGQLTVIGLAFGAVVQVHRRPWYRRRVVIPASVALATTGLVWTVQRIASLG